MATVIYADDIELTDEMIQEHLQRGETVMQHGYPVHNTVEIVPDDIFNEVFREDSRPIYYYNEWD